ncbi:hypothetical protein OPQ81_000582 [Rhizoctonia solani]|nr:hypothetical protein OPQ81_000582 [Rhizoctonia solani]
MPSKAEKCLGYEESKPRARVRQEHPTVPIPSQLPLTSPVVPAQTERSEIPDSVEDGLSESCQGPTNANVDHDPRPSILGAAMRYRINRAISSDNDNRTSTAYGHSSKANQLTRSNNGDLVRVIRATFQSIPRSVDATQMIREDHSFGALYAYEFQRMIKQVEKMMWTLYLVARVLQTLGQNSSGTAVHGCISWIDKFDQKISTISHGNPSPNDVADLLMVRLELAYLKFSTVNTASGYVILQKSLPRFLQLVAANSNLYMELSNGNLAASFPPHLLCTPESPATGNTNMTKFAVQESWRQVALIYIYMGRCGVSSHNPRVQASVHRIFRLGEIGASVLVGIHMFTHCVATETILKQSPAKFRNLVQPPLAALRAGEGEKNVICPNQIARDASKVAMNVLDMNIAKRYSNSTPSIPSRLPPIPPATPTEAVRSETLNSVMLGFSESWQGSADTNVDHDPGPSILGAAMIYRMSRTISSADDVREHVDPSEGFDPSWPQEQGQLAVYSHSRTHQSSHTRATRAMYQSIPPSVDATQIMREGYIVRVINEYHLRRVNAWFMPPPTLIRDSLVARLKGEPAKTPLNTAVGRYIGWIDNLEQRLTRYSCNHPSTNDVADCLMAQLELAFLKFTIVDNVSGYISLKKALPGFFQLVAGDTNLYTEHSNGYLIVSFPRTLSSPRHELKRFVLYDTVSSLVLGIPPLVDYGYDEECDPGSHGLEWVHGIPVALMEIISQINTWRAGSRIAPMDNWQVLERRVLAWQPVGQGSEDSVTGSVARLAVQESWRHVVLIYIYMGVCGVSSHDPRVQASVHRIVQLGETVADLLVGIHTFTQCIAGLAARLERHRILVHQMLLSFNGTRAWLFRGPQFSQVLYHLWHGVGAEGAPVTWDDYVQSRCTVTPI